MILRRDGTPAICKECKQPIDTTPRSKYCQQCRKKHINQYKEQWYEKRRQEKQEKKKEFVPVRCIGCKYYKRASGCFACNYGYETGQCRKIDPIDCYRRKGTPYTPLECMPKRGRKKGGHDDIAKDKGKAQKVSAAKVRKRSRT